LPHLRRYTLAMQAKRRWFQTATMMALFAVLALFVSPVLAWDCCCNAHTASISSPAVPALDLEGLASGNHPCCPSTTVSGSGTIENYNTTEAKFAKTICTTISNVCDCDDSTLGVIALNERFSGFNFFPLGTILTAQHLFSPTGSERIVTYFNIATRPRGPDSRTRSSRGPPTSLSS
jgi:hypothetical protein